jgi:hypothetical protein
MSLSRSQILALPGVQALVVAGLAKGEACTYADLVANPGNADAIVYASKQRKKDSFCYYCKAILAIRELEKVLPMVSPSPAPPTGPSLALVACGKARALTAPPDAGAGAPALLDQVAEKEHFSSKAKGFFDASRKDWRVQLVLSLLMIVFPRLIVSFVMQSLRAALVTSATEAALTVKETATVAVNTVNEAAEALESAFQPLLDPIGTLAGTVNPPEVKSVTGVQSILLALASLVVGRFFNVAPAPVAARPR